MTAVDVEVVNPLEVAVSSVNTPNGPNDVALIPLAGSAEKPRNSAAAVT